MTKLGIMQGRLVPPANGRFQSFPRDRWREEFAFAKQVPLSYIEWIYDLYGADLNPLLNDPTQLWTLASQSGVMIRSLCADYFMDLPFLRCSEEERRSRQRVFDQLIQASPAVGIQRIVLPFVDASKIETSQDLDTVVGVLTDALPAARKNRIELHLETSLGPTEFASLLGRMEDPLVKANYDSGNSSSLGYKPREEFAAYGERVGSVHIKDRIRGGGTVPLGTGDADLPAVFESLAKVGYTGDITLQVARSEPGNEVLWARANKAFVTQYWAIE